MSEPIRRPNLKCNASSKPKSSYPSKDEAWYFAVKCGIVYKIMLFPYECKVCKMWHLTKQRQMNRTEEVKLCDTQ